MDGIPLPSFWYVAVFGNNFTFSGKPLIFLTRLQVYFVGGGAAGGLWRHQQWSPSWLPSWILPRIRNQVKTAGNSNFCDGMILFLKKHVLSPKIGVTSCTFDVISRNHSTWPSLNLSQNLREGWTNSYWKCQVLMFYPLRKNSAKPFLGGGWHPPPPPLVKFYGSFWGRKLLIRTPAKNVFWRPLNCKTEFAKNVAHAQLTTLASLPPQTVLSVSKFRSHYEALELLVCWRVISVLSSLKQTWLYRLL